MSDHPTEERPKYKVGDIVQFDVTIKVGGQLFIEQGDCATIHKIERKVIMINKNKAKRPIRKVILEVHGKVVT